MELATTKMCLKDNDKTGEREESSIFLQFIRCLKTSGVCETKLSLQTCAYLLFPFWHRETLVFDIIYSFELKYVRHFVSPYMPSSLWSIFEKKLFI